MNSFDYEPSINASELTGAHHWCAHILAGIVFNVHSTGDIKAYLWLLEKKTALFLFAFGNPDMVKGYLFSKVISLSAVRLSPAPTDPQLFYEQFTAWTDSEHYDWMYRQLQYVAEYNLD